MSTQDSTANSTSGLSQTADQNASFQQIVQQKFGSELQQVFYYFFNINLQVKSFRHKLGFFFSNI